jgi:DNA polymerase III epsilon subunit-like protein
VTVRCIDIETTGTDPVYDPIVEIASVDLQRDNTITNCKQTLVRDPYADGVSPIAVSSDKRNALPTQNPWRAQHPNFRDIGQHQSPTRARYFP